MYQLELDNSNRISLISIMPAESNLIDRISIKEIKSKVNFNAEEIKQLGIKVDDKLISWDENPTKAFTFTNAELHLLKRFVDDLDKKSKVSDNLLPICLMIQDAKEMQNEEEKKEAA